MGERNLNTLPVVLTAGGNNIIPKTKLLLREGVW